VGRFGTGHLLASRMATANVHSSLEFHAKLLTSLLIFFIGIASHASDIAANSASS
jgi:hypothetical protein